MVKISIVIPILNCAETIEQTLLSVLSQGYKELELIVVDGESTDGTLDVIKKYTDQIDQLIVEKDEGQYHAINKGFTVATGDVYAWLNGDDIYLPGALSAIASVFGRYDDVQWVSGLPGFLNENGEYVRIDSSPAVFPQNFIENGWYRPGLCGYLQQESMFWRKALWEKCNGLNPELRLAADFELWTRFACQTKLVQVVSPLAAFRFVPGMQRSVVFADEYISEVQKVAKSLSRPPFLWARLANLSQVWEMSIRFFIWRKTELIVYRRETLDWAKINCFCNISRRALMNLITDYIGQKKK